MIADLLHHGEPWWAKAVAGDITAAGHDVITPQATVRRRGSFNNQDTAQRKEDPADTYRLILLGFSYRIYSGASAGDGFVLYWNNQIWSPGGETRNTIFSATAGTAAVTLLEGTVDHCFIVGSKGGVLTPAATAEPAAALGIQRATATALTNGTVLMWGLEVPADLPLGRFHTGSPAINLGASPSWSPSQSPSLREW